MRKGLVILGVAVLILGAVLFVVGWLESIRAAAAYLSCFMGGTLICTDVLASMALWGTIENLGILLGVVGLVVLIVGAVLQEEGARPMPPYPAQYPPPAYPAAYPPPAYPPPVYPPAQDPKSPPPGTG